MTILMLIDNYYPLIGGAERQVDTLARRLLKKGIKVRVVTEKKEKDWKQDEIINGIPVKRIPFPEIRLLGSMVLFLSLFLYLFKTRKEYDIIHVHIAKYFAFIAAIIGSHTGKKVIIKISGWEELDKGILNEQQRKKPLYRLLTWGIKKADYFIAVSKEIESALKRCNFPSDRIVYLPNGVDTELFYPPEKEEKQSLREKINIKASIAGIFVGRLVNEKGLTYLINAWKDITIRNPDAKLYLLGNGYLLKRLKDMTSEYNLKDNLVFKGTVDNVYDYLKSADLFILPSVTEGLSNTMLEAMATGLPVVGTRISGNEDLIINKKNGFLVPPKDSKALSEAIQTLLTDKNLRENMGKSSRRIIEERYSIDKIVDRYLELYGSSGVAGERVTGCGAREKNSEKL